jgi:hypothetical protein
MATAQFSKISGSGDASIYNCYNSHLGYTSISNSYITNATGIRKYSTIIESHSLLVTHYTNTTVPTKTLCDQWPRVLGPTVTPVTLTFTDSHPITKKEVYPGPAPTCKIADPECNVAYSAYDTATYSYLSSTFYKFFAEGKVGLPPNMYFGTLTPPCAAGGRIASCPTATANSSCTLNAAQATVFYWPASTPASLDCRTVDAKATTTEEESEEPTIFSDRLQAIDTPRTAIYGNTTITSPAALVILRSMSAQAASKATKPNQFSNWQPCGNHIDATLTVPPSALSTMRNSWTISYQNEQYTQWGSSKTPHSLAVADLLPGHVSYDAYAAIKNCNPSSTAGCPKTISDDYTPTLSLPSEATAVGINSEFAICKPSLVQNAVYIPITAATITMPPVTKYGMTVTTGPKETLIEAAVVGRFMQAEVVDGEDIDVRPEITQTPAPAPEV